MTRAVYTQTVPSALYLTESDEANALLAREPLALLIGFALDQQVREGGGLVQQRPSRVWSLQAHAPEQKTMMTAAVLFSLMFAASFHIRKEGMTLMAPTVLLVLFTFFWLRSWWWLDRT